MVVEPDAPSFARLVLTVSEEPMVARLAKVWSEPVGNAATLAAPERASVMRETRGATAGIMLGGVGGVGGDEVMRCKTSRR